MKKLSILILMLIVSGCASIKVTPPVETTIERSRTYKLPFEKVWARAVDWYADHNVTIEKIEKPSGLLTAKYIQKLDDKAMDCGVIDVSGILGDPSIEKIGTLNVTVRSINDNETKVNVNIFGEFRLQASDSWDGRLVTSSGSCVSTGSLEKSILHFIEP